MRRSPEPPGRPIDRAGLDALVARRAFQAERATDAEVDRIVGLADPMERIVAHAALSRLLAEEGAALSPAASDRILRTLHRDAEAIERQERRARYLAEQAEAERLDRMRPPVLWFGLPAAVLLPGIATSIMAGWGFLDVGAAALELPRLVGAPLAFCVAALAGAGVLAWMILTATRTDRVVMSGAWGLAAGLALLVGLKALPVYKASDAARLANGASLGGSVVRVEPRWPEQPDLLHVLRGNARIARGTVLTIEGGRPVAYLRGW